MSYTEVFGGNSIEPADVSYRAVALSANVTLAWPTETNAGSDVVAALLDVTPSAGSLVITMPSALLTSPGRQVIFNNVGAHTFTVVDADGGALLTVDAGEAWVLWLRTNAVAAGTWRSIQLGAGSSSAQAAALAGAGLTAISDLLAQEMPVTSFSADYEAGTADRAKLMVWTGGAGTLSFAAAATLGTDWFINVRNAGTGALVLDPSGAEQINNATTITLNPDDSAIVATDGAEFYTVGLGQSASFAFDYISIDLTGEVSPYSISGAELNRIAYRLGGTLTADMNVIVPTTIQQYWVKNDTTGSFDLQVKTLAGTGITVAQGAAAILYCDGVNIVAAETRTLTTPIAVVDGGTGASTAGAALINLGGGSAGIAVFESADAATARDAIDAAGIDDAFTIAVAMG